MKNASTRFYFEEFVLDLDRQLLRRDDHEVPLRRKTFGVLCHLVEQRHRVVSKEELLDVVWPGRRIEPQGVFQSVSELRSVFGQRRFIRTVRGSGYQWVTPTANHPGKLPQPARAKYSHWGLAACMAMLLAAALIVAVPGAAPVQTPDHERFAASDGLLELARSRLARGALDSAENFLALVLEENPNHLEARLDMAYILQERGLSDSALDLAEQVHSESIATGTAYVRMASAALISQLPKSASVHSGYYAHEAISIGTRLQLPAFAAAGHERLGELYLDQGEPTLAAIEWTKAIEHYHESCPANEDRVRKMLASIARDSG